MKLETSFQLPELPALEALVFCGAALLGLCWPLGSLCPASLVSPEWAGVFLSATQPAWLFALA